MAARKIGLRRTKPVSRTSPDYSTPPLGTSLSKTCATSINSFQIRGFFSAAIPLPNVCVKRTDDNLRLLRRRNLGDASHSDGAWRVTKHLVQSGSGAPDFVTVGQWQWTADLGRRPAAGGSPFPLCPDRNRASGHRGPFSCAKLTTRGHSHQQEQRADRGLARRNLRQETSSHQSYSSGQSTRARSPKGQPTTAVQLFTRQM